MSQTPTPEKNESAVTKDTWIDWKERSWQLQLEITQLRLMIEDRENVIKELQEDREVLKTYAANRNDEVTKLSSKINKLKPTKSAPRKRK